MYDEYTQETMSLPLHCTHLAPCRIESNHNELVTLITHGHLVIFERVHYLDVGWPTILSSYFGICRPYPVLYNQFSHSISETALTSLLSFHICDGDTAHALTCLYRRTPLTLSNEIEMVVSLSLFCCKSWRMANVFVPSARDVLDRREPPSDVCTCKQYDRKNTCNFKH